MNFICADTEDNSVELLRLDKSGFDKAITQIAAMTGSGDKFYAGTPDYPKMDIVYLDILTDAEKFKEFKANKTFEWDIFIEWCEGYLAWQKQHSLGLVKTCLKWLEGSQQKYIYFHNLQYDLGNLFADKLDRLDITMVGGRIIKAGWGKKIFVDSYNIWPMKLAKLGEAFGLEKLKTENMAADKEYVYRDVEILHKAMTFAWGFCDSLELNHLPPTLGGLCVKVWKHFGGEGNSHDSSVLSRKALYGGRVELFHICDDWTWEHNDPSLIYAAFNGTLPKDKTVEDLVKFGTQNVYWTDINSLYPYVMTFDYPGALEHWDITQPFPKYGIATVTIKQPETLLPVLPYRGKDGRILYPTGVFTGTWTIHEINYAVANGATIVEVKDIIGTNEGVKCYATFVEKLYQARLDSDSEAEKLFFKLLMNNLYGRLGTSGIIGRSVWQDEKNKHNGIPYGEKVMVKYKMPLSDETNWCHAAYVTAYGRIELHKFMKLIGAERMIYCDTDSCVFNCPDGKVPFVIDKGLGKMKLEGVMDGAIAFAPKMYRIGKTFKAKGVPKHLAEQFINSGHAEFDLPYKLREAMRFYDRNNSKRLSVWRNVSKARRTNYDRKKLKDNTFFPCKINQP